VLAAASDRREKLVRAVRDKQEVDAWRRLLEAFQQRIRGIHVERFCGMDYDGFGAGAVRRYVDESAERTDLVDPDGDSLFFLAFLVLGLSRTFRLDLTVIRVPATFEPRTGAAVAAPRILDVPRFTQEQLRQCARECELADAARSAQEKRVGKILSGGSKPVKLSLVPGKGF
jgi:hypothetical protein